MDFTAAKDRMEETLQYFNLLFRICSQSNVNNFGGTYFPPMKFLSFISYSDKPVCDFCSERYVNIAISFCKTCTSSLDMFCVTCHQRRKDFQGHKVIDLSAVHQSELKMSTFLPVINCNVCKNELKDICLTCKTLVCERCTKHLHENHPFSSTDEFSHLLDTVFNNSSSIIKILEKSRPGSTLIRLSQSRVQWSNILCPCRSIIAGMLCHLLENPSSENPEGEVLTCNAVFENFNHVIERWNSVERDVPAPQDPPFHYTREVMIAEGGISDDIQSFELFGDGTVQQASHQETPEQECRDFQQDIAFNEELVDYIPIHEAQPSRS